MHKVFRTLFELVLLVFALNILYGHIQSIWYAQGSIGLSKAIEAEWATASLPMLGALAIVIGFIIFEIWAFKKDEHERIEERLERHKDILELRSDIQSLTKELSKVLHKIK